MLGGPVRAGAAMSLLFLVGLRRERARSGSTNSVY